MAEADRGTSAWQDDVRAELKGDEQTVQVNGGLVDLQLTAAALQG